MNRYLNSKIIENTLVKYLLYSSTSITGLNLEIGGFFVS